jgi:hypothetical protein
VIPGEHEEASLDAELIAELDIATDAMTDDGERERFASHADRLNTEIEMLRSLVRKLSTLMPGPRGREVLLPVEEHHALMRALGEWEETK